MARRHRRGGSKAGRVTKGGKRHGLLSSKGHHAHPFVHKGGRYSTMKHDGMDKPLDGPLIRSSDANMAGATP
jgi:hypothetical protein